MSASKLILVDGLAALYRAYFAIPGLSTRSGQATNAVFGLVRMLNQLRDTWQPTHWAVVFDGGLPEERLRLQPDYKAQRPEMPEALRSQMPIVEDYLGRAGIRWVRTEGQEADDVIASMVAAWRDRATKTLIASNDKDLYQLVNDRVRLVPVAGKGAPIGPREVMQKTGVAPSKVVDWLALVGDEVDNIAGVRGVGPKTAAKLLHDYGSLEGIWRHLDELASRKLRGALLYAGREAVFRNAAMIRLRDDLECPFDWSEIAFRPPDAERLIPLFEKLEFGSLARDLREGSLFGE